jgi:hypothetical protein
MPSEILGFFEPLEKAPCSQSSSRPNGGYKKLLSYQRSETVYDATVYFCDHFIDRRSRTQAACASE